MPIQLDAFPPHWLGRKSDKLKTKEQVLPRITPVIIWVWICAGLNCAGWGLSALGQLNPTGYAAVLVLGFAGLAWWWRSLGAPRWSPLVWRKCRRRFHRGFPLAFLLIGGLAFLGGLIYTPTNYDALSYRIPRVLHWLDLGHWHWIQTIYPRVNNRSCGIEWVSAPLIAFLKTDRWLFIINIISFFLLPGLIYRVFTRLGVRPRAAWYWMWLVPSGYCYLQQAGSVGNDLFCATFVLAAMDFALQTRTNPTAINFFTSIMAAAMMTSAKTTSLPLLLPWAIAILPSLKLISRWPLRFAFICALAAFASVMPTLALNAKFTNGKDWSGGGVVLKSADQAPSPAIRAVRLGINIGSLALNNFVPPLFPMAKDWNNLMDRSLPPWWHDLSFKAGLYEPGLATFHVEEMQVEENCGLGLGVTALLAATWLAAGRTRKSTKSATPADFWTRAILWSAWLALIVVLIQSTLSALSRLVTPYYALLLPLFLVRPGIGHISQRPWWRVGASLVFLTAGSLLLISPARPLLPMLTVLEKLQTIGVQHNDLDRPIAVYSIYRDRNDALAPLRKALEALPDGRTTSLGLVAFDTPETSLWRPFGSHRIIHVYPLDSAEQLKNAGIKYILVAPGGAGNWFETKVQLSLEDWMKNINASLVKKLPVTVRADYGPETWSIIRLD